MQEKQNEPEERNDNEHEVEIISFWGIPRKWAELAFKISSLIFLGYAVWIIRDEALKENRLIDAISAITIKLAAFSVAEAATFAALYHGGDLIVFWTTKLIAQLTQRDKKAEARGEARGIQIGEARKQAEVDREWVEWYQRKETAENAGEPFNEPSPAERHALQSNSLEEDGGA